VVWKPETGNDSHSLYTAPLRHVRSTIAAVGNFPTNEQHETFITLKGTETRMQAPLCKCNLCSATIFCSVLQIAVGAS
jgi:hypothetical protein